MIRSTLSGFALLTASLLSLPAPAAELPTLVIPQGVGVNIHFSSGHEKDLDMIAAAGIKVVRADFPWAEIERYQGVYNWSAYEELAKNMTKRGLRPLFILSYSNALYEETVRKYWQGVWPYYEVNSPQHARSVEAFSNWSAAAAKHFKKYNVMWEIWNEPNINSFWKPTPDVAAYTRLALSACNAIRKADANTTIVAPAASLFPWDYLEFFFKAGALNCIDAVSVHPYRANIPETVTDDYARLRKLVDQYTSPNRKQIPILSGEWGYSTERFGVPLDDQANYVVRMQLINLLNGVSLSVWYDWKNDGTDAGNNEHNYGLVSDVLAPKVSYEALKTFTTQLSGYHFVRRLDIGHENDYALLFADDKGRSKIAAWTIGWWARDVRILIANLPLSSKPMVIDGHGRANAAQLEEHMILLRLSNSPVYIAL